MPSFRSSGFLTGYGSVNKDKIVFIYIVYLGPLYHNVLPPDVTDPLSNNFFENRVLCCPFITRSHNYAYFLILCQRCIHTITSNDKKY